ncbi:MAG: hypothetical protein NVSMB64_16290 [Candidatus Velthaea sp.]
MLRCLTAAILALSSLAPQGAVAADVVPKSVSVYYNEVLATMNALPAPQTMLFRTSMTASGIGIRLSEEDGEARLLVGLGSGFKHDAFWDTRFESPDSTTVTLSDHHDVGASSPLFNPTWNGAYDWLRYGLRGKSSDAADAVRSPVPVSSGSDINAGDATAPATIGIVHAIGTAFYHVEDAGDAACASGSAARHLHLTAWNDARTHPVTDVYVDSASNRICMLRFNLGSASALSLTGSFELHFATVEKYWLVVDGEAQLLYRTFGIGAKHASLHIKYDRTSLT